MHSSAEVNAITWIRRISIDSPVDTFRTVVKFTLIPSNASMRHDLRQEP
jgi:hypothetical protein